jgi:hypothetical protein
MGLLIGHLLHPQLRRVYGPREEASTTIDGCCLISVAENPRI